MKNNIIFVSGGLNTRFKELSVFPKVLLQTNILDSILLNNMKVLGENNYYLIINEKYYFMVDNFIKQNNVNIKLISSSNSNGSYNTIKSLTHSLPKENLLFIWGDLVLTKTFEFEKEDIIIFKQKGNYRFVINDLNQINETSESNGNIPGIYFINDLNLLTTRLDEFNNYDLIEDLKKNENIKTVELQNNLIEFRDKKIYTQYINEFNSKNINSNNCRYFNEMKIENSVLTKKCINEFYLNLIQNEINWYKNCQTKLLFPHIYSSSRNSIVMEYLSDYETINNYLNRTKDFSILDNILDNLKELHSDNINISEADLHRDLQKEFKDKVKDRVFSIKNTLINYEEKKFLNLIEEGYNFILQYFLNKETKYSFIHGDLNGSNILVLNNDIKFIDPRGYFGDVKCYGIKEYDYAKLNYFLSGYDYINNNLINYYEVDLNKISLYKHSKLNIKIINIITSLIWICLTSYISNDILKINLSYNIGIKMLEENLNKN